VRLEVEVPTDHLKHAVEHASSDLAESTKIPGFRKGKVPQKVLEARLGRDRIFGEAVESHIGGWFWNAAEDASIRPVSRPELTYDLPTTDDQPFNFTAEVDVQPLPEVADWNGLETKEQPPAPPAPDGYTGNENATGDASPGSIANRPSRTPAEKSIDSRARRGGVPVFKRPHSNPSDFSDSASSREGGSPARPAGRCSGPM